MNHIQTALRIIRGARAKSYGCAADDFSGVAQIWNGILGPRLREPIRATDVPLMMVGLKLRRQGHRHKDDNLVDIHGYIALLSEILNQQPKRKK